VITRRWVYVVPILIAAVVAGWWWSAGASGTPVTMTIVLDGGICQTGAHSNECRNLASGNGGLALIGPIREGEPSPDVREIKLDGAVQRLTVHLSPGSYDLAFEIDPPGTLLLPNFGTATPGGFSVGSSGLDLGRIQPSSSWETMRD
jgi:hypothetical protein